MYFQLGGPPGRLDLIRLELLSDYHIHILDKAPAGNSPVLILDQTPSSHNLTSVEVTDLFPVPTPCHRHPRLALS